MNDVGIINTQKISGKNEVQNTYIHYVCEKKQISTRK